MPHRIVTKDGIAIEDIPDDIAPTDQRIRDMVAQMRASGETSRSFGGAPAQPTQTQTQPQPVQGQGQGQGTPPPFNPDPMAQVQAQPLQMGAGRVQDLVMSPPRVANIPETAMNMMGGVVRGAGPIAAGTLAGGIVGGPPGALAGGGAMGLAQMAGDPIISGINKLFGTNYTMPTDAIEDLFTRIGVAEPKTEAEKLVQTVAYGAAQGGSDVMLGKALQMGAGLAPATRDLVGKALASGPLQQILSGAGGAAGAGVAAQAGLGPVAQFGVGVLGSTAGSIAGNAMSLRPAGVHPMQGAVDASEKLNTQLKTSDVFPPQTNLGKMAQVGTERIPFSGMGPVRAKQQKDRIEDIKNLFAQFGAGETVARASDDVMLDLANKRSANFTRWETMKDQALETVATTSPNARVTMPRTVIKIDEALASLRSLNNSAVKPGIDKLLDAKVSFENQTAGNVLKNKRILGDVFNSEELSAVKHIINKELEDTYEAVRLDLTDFMETAGSAQAKNKWMIANAEETKLFRELDNKVLANTLETGKARPEVVKNMIMNKDRSVVESLRRNLTAKGRAFAVTAVLQEVAKKVDDSPEKLITELQRLSKSGDPLGAFMQPDDLKALEGLSMVLKAATRAGQAGLNPPTGQQLYIPLGVATGLGVTGELAKWFGGGGTGAALSAGIGVTGLGLAGAAARVYESAPVRNILMQIPTVKPGSKEEMALFKRLLEAAKATQAASASQSRTERQAPAQEFDQAGSK